MNKKTLFAISTVTVLFTACGGGGGGGGGSSSSSSSSRQVISGSVIDPAIKGATVSLECGSNSYPAYSTSSETGGFSIPVPRGMNLSECIIKSVGGTDVDGDELDGLTLKSAYKLYNSRTGLLVTPLTHAVVEHDDFNTNLEQAQNQVATFFDISKEDLKKDPRINMNLQRKTKKITKIALKKNTGGQAIGFIDIDDTSKVTESTFDSFVTNEVAGLITAEEKAELDEEIIDIDTSSSSSEMIKNNITRNLFKRLKVLYKFTDASYDTNLKYLSKKIVEASSSNSSYSNITKRQERKALLDTGLTESFKIVDGKTSDTLVDSLITEFSKTEADFKSMIDSKTINIQNLNQSYQDAKTYETIVGDDIATRRSYYQLIDNSHIAKAYQLIGDVRTDDVLDPINIEVSKALANLGAYDDAFENIKNNVYRRSDLQDGYKDLGNIILANKDNNTKAGESFLEEYLQIRSEIQSVGESLGWKYLNDLQANARRLGLSENYIKSDETIDYMVELAKKASKSSYYLRAPVALKDLAIANLLLDNNVVNARKYMAKAVELLDEIPIASSRDNRTAIFNIFNTINSELKLGEFTENNNNLTNLLNKYDPAGTYYISPTSSYGSYYIVNRSLSNNPTQYQNALTDFNKISDSRKYSPLTSGFAAGAVLNGDIDKVFTEMFTNKVFSTTRRSIDYIFKYHIQEKDTADLYTIQILRTRGRDDLAELFLDKLDQLADEAINDSNPDPWQITPTVIKNLYSSWGNTSTFKHGYIKLADWYNKLNKPLKAEAAITKAINKIVSITDQEEKTTGIINLLWGTEEIGVQKDSDVQRLLVELKSSAGHADMEKIELIIEAANYLSKYNKKADAISLIEKAYSLIDTKVNGDIEVTRKRLTNLVGNYSSASENFKYSIANGYFQAGNIQKAKETIKEALDDVLSLQTTDDQAPLYRNISNAYAGINDYKRTVSVINRIRTSKEEHEARVEAASYFAKYDAFGNSNVASVDSDNDGKPDFWNYGVSAQDITDSGLTLDEDIDNDGILDSTDTLPYDGIE